MRKTTKIWLFVLCVIVLSTTLFLYWTRKNSSFGTPGTAAVTSNIPSTGGSVTMPNQTQPPTVDKPSETLPAKKDPPLDEAVDEPKTEEVIEAINYLDAVDTQASPKDPDAEMETEDHQNALSQDELFELVHEGVSYYESLLESGSVDFFLQASSTNYPGEPRLPNGNWQGSFEFSDNRFRGTVTQNATDYDEKFGDVSLSDTKQFAYDGETFENLKETRHGLTLVRRSDNASDPSFDPRNWGWQTDEKGSLTNFIKTLGNPYIQPVDLDGTEVYHLTGILQDNVTVELWLNPEKSYRPERQTFFVSDGEVSQSIVKNYTYQEVAPDLWFPKSAEEIGTFTDLNTNVETTLQTRTVQFSNLRINEYIPSSRFMLDAPSGTTVYDHRSRETVKIE